MNSSNNELVERSEVGRLQVALRRRGAGEPVLYLHGDAFTRQWPAFLQQLSEECAVLAPEHPGYGDSEIDDTIQSFEDLVLHYDALLDTLGQDRVHLVGHALGGWLAANLAVVYPRRFKSLTLMTPMGLRIADAPLIDVFRMTPEETLAALFNGRGEAFADLFVHDGEPEDTIRSLTERATAARLMWNPRYDHRLEHRLQRVVAPTLVLGVQDDRMVPTATAARYAELITDARLETLPGAPGQPSGHAVHVEQPEAVAALVAAHVTANA
jgi:pimeloyl-ACP methyl ester carboxylesterase